MNGIDQPNVAIEKLNKWSEKTTLEKVATIIAGIALCVWLVFEYLDSHSSVAFAKFLHLQRN